MNLRTQLAILLLVGIGSYFLGYSNRQIQIKEVVKEVIVEKEAETKIVTRWRDRTITKEKIIRPDGTIEERLIRENSELKTALEDRKKELDFQKNKEKISETKLATVSAGVRIPLKYSELLPTSKELLQSAEITGGLRVLGPLWLDGGISPGSKQVTIGVRYEH